ncbi:MAG: polysaccharide export protein [Nitrospirae bacterium]|nr:polysaccharide export protein [Nitrospirota bacterium]
MNINRLSCVLLIFIYGCASITPDTSTLNRKGQLEELIDDELQNSANGEISMLGPGDVININVYRHTDLSLSSVTLRPDGSFSFPLVGQVQAKGLSVKELEQKMEESLAQYIVKPQVIINAQKITSHKMYVLGEVSRPGMILVEDDLTLIQAIAQSGGVTQDAKASGIVLLRKGKVYTLNLTGVLKGISGDNIRLKSGDILYVPPSSLADAGRFISDISRLLGFVISVESGIILTPQVGDALRGKSGNTAPIAIPSK